VHLLAAWPGRLVAGGLDAGQVGALLLDVDQLVHAAQRATLDPTLQRAGPDPDAGPDAEPVDRRARLDQVVNRVLVQVAAHQDARHAQPGIVERLPHIARIALEVAAIEPHRRQ